MFWGLLLRRNLGYTNIVLETDSSCALNLIKLGVLVTHSYSSLIVAVRNLLSEDLNVDFIHIFREANRCANSLAKFGHRLSKGISFFDKLPSYISLDFLADSQGQGGPV